MFYFINHNLQNPLFDAVMPFITHFGGYIAMFAICILVLVLSIVFKKDNIKKIALICLISLLVADGIALVLKLLIFEPRPYLMLDNVHVLIVEDDPFSFPSGHVTSTCAVVFALIFKFKDKLWSFVLLLFAFIIGFSRIYVGVHYPSDVLAGAIIGIFGAYVVHRYEDRILAYISHFSNKLPK